MNEEREMRAASYQAAFLIMCGTEPPTGEVIRSYFDRGVDVEKAVQDYRVARAAHKIPTAQAWPGRSGTGGF